MDAANHQKPCETTCIFLDEIQVCAHRFDQRFVVQHEGDLDRTKRDNQRAHENPRNRQVIEDPRDINEIRKHQWEPEYQRANRDNNARPLQHIAKASHGESE